MDNSHVREGNNLVSIGLRYIEEVTRKLDQDKSNLCVSLVSRAANLVYRRTTSLEVILYSSVPGNLRPAILLSSCSDLGVSF